MSSAATTTMSTGELAERLAGRCTGRTDLLIHGVGALEDADSGKVVYASGRRNFLRALESSAGAILTKKAFTTTDRNLILVDDPRQAYLQCLDIFSWQEDPGEGISTQSSIDSTAVLGRGVLVQPFVYIGPHVRVGDNTKVHSGVHIGQDVTIGSDCTIHSGVRIHGRVSIGNNVILFANAVIGGDGFGYEKLDDGTYRKIPQIGRVEIQDKVEIGANSTIDRATAGTTLIGRGVKIDNLVQIAHNVRIGENTVIAAQSGVAGSTSIGQNCILAGQVGIADHCEIGDNVLIGAKSGVQSHRIPAGKSYFGMPAREMNEMKRILAAQAKLPEMAKKLQNTLQNTLQNKDNQEE